MFIKRGLKGFSKGSGISGEFNLPSRMHCLETFVNAQHCAKRATLFRNNVPSVAYVARTFHGLVAVISESRYNHRTKVSCLSSPFDDSRRTEKRVSGFTCPLQRIIFLQLHYGRDILAILVQCRTIGFTYKQIFANTSTVMEIIVYFYFCIIRTFI